MVRGQISRYGWMLLLALIFSGLWRMHGMATTPSESVPHSVMGGMPHEQAAEGSMPSAPAHDQSLPGHGSHPGEICLALLVLAVLLVTLAEAKVLRLARPALWGGTSTWRGPPLACPPNLHQISVLRI
jgi:hypothetical protein